MPRTTAHPPERPLVVWDGDCGFCRRFVERWRATTGDAVEYAPYQEAAARFPDLPVERFRDATHLILPSGVVHEGADAVYRAVAHAPGRGAAAWAYGRVPGFARASELVYAFVARHRPLAARVTRLLAGDDLRPATFVLTRWLFLRLLALVSLAAFASFWSQAEGLVGSRGILPAAELVERVRAQADAGGLGWLERLREFPTVLWTGASDGALDLVGAGGVVASLLLFVGVLPGPALLAAWLLYLSIATVGGVFFRYQWDALLLETMFAALFLVPWRARLRPGLDADVPVSRAGLLLLRLLLFKLMFLSGVVKLASRDPAWRELTALEYHYWSQPLPSWSSFYAHHLPGWFHAASAWLVFAIELALPFLVFVPRRARVLAFAGFLLLQLVIAATGSYGFFNLLTVALCFLLLDDRALRRLAPRRLAPRLPERPPPRRRRATVAAALVAAPLVLLSAAKLARGAGEADLVPDAVARLERWVGPLSLSSGYGLFARMTRVRREILVEGSDDGVTGRSTASAGSPTAT